MSLGCQPSRVGSGCPFLTSAVSDLVGQVANHFRKGLDRWQGTCSRRARPLRNNRPRMIEFDAGRACSAMQPVIEVLIGSLAPRPTAAVGNPLRAVLGCAARPRLHAVHPEELQRASERISARRTRCNASWLVPVALANSLLSRGPGSKRSRTPSAVMMDRLRPAASVDGRSISSTH
jgi:hypothetical protein